MHAHLAIASTLISSSLAAMLAPAAVESTSPALITPGPQIELLRRQNSDRFMGWLELLPGRWTSMTCSPGNTFYQTGSLWACCATTRTGCANMVVGCQNGNMVYSTMGTASGASGGLITRACTSIWTASEDISYSVCNTGFLYENSVDNSPKSNIFCGVVSSNWSYYRQAPATTATTRSSSRVGASATPTSTSPVLIPTPIQPSVIPPAPQKEESKAWIAGAVVGPLVGLALIGLGIFFFMRRKKNKASNVAPATGSVGPAPTAYQQNANFPTDPNLPPGYYPPPMQQNAGAPGFVPMGVQKQDSYYGQPQSPLTQGSQSPNPQSPYGAPQQWQQPGGQPVYGVPSPSMSPAPPHAQPAQYHVGETRPFSSELEGSNMHGQPEQVNVQPKTH